MTELKAPFPAFGGKAQVADLVWERIGNVRNAIEPFVFSGAWMLRRPTVGAIETINDLNCLAPETRILRADLSWGPIGGVAVGDMLLGFDEHNGPSQRSTGPQAPSSYRRWRTSKVLAVTRIMKPCYRLRFDDGTEVVASDDHAWLVGSHPRSSAGKGGRGWRWGMTKSLISNRRTQRSWVLKIAPVQAREETHDAGWLGGVYDGEGSVSGVGGGQLNFTQRPGVVLDRTKALLTARGFRFSESVRPDDCRGLKVIGGQSDVLRFLMLARPERLIRNFVGALSNRSIYGREHNAVGLVEKEYVGVCDVVALQTESRTFVAEGLASHNCFVANFWRAVQQDPDAVAAHADWPVNEADLHARHRWLVRSEEAQATLAGVRTDPDAFDAKIAGWWCWGACMWIGSGWCETQQLPHLSHGQGVNGLTQQLPHLDPTRGVLGQRPDAETGGKRPRTHGSTNGYMPGVLNGVDPHITKKLPKLCNGGSGNGNGVLIGPKDADQHRPQLADAYSRGRGVNGNDDLGTCEARRAWLTDWMRRLCDRLRPVRVCCGHWARVCDSESTLTRLGTTGVFLDPPYRKTLEDGTENRAAHIYANDKCQDIGALCDEVQEWCLRWGGNAGMRIVLCGLEGEYPAIDAAGWEKVAWKSRGGYGNRTDRGKENAARERLWFSPHCVHDAPLFNGTRTPPGGETV